MATMSRYCLVLDGRESSKQEHPESGIFGDGTVLWVVRFLRREKQMILTRKFFPLKAFFP
jgi:hypothetical protein